METLKEKVRMLTQKRRTNALKCLKVVRKYEQLLDIRVKDTVFRFWDRIRREEGAIQTTHQTQMMASIDNNNEEECGLAGGCSPQLSPSFNLIHDTTYTAQNDCSIMSVSNI